MKFLQVSSHPIVAGSVRSRATIIRGALPLVVLVAALAGCTLSQPAPESIVRIPISRPPGPGVEVKSADLQSIGGRLYAKGALRLTAGRPANTGIRVDVSLRDAEGREVGHRVQTVAVQSRTAGPHLVAPFWVPLDPWPAAIADVRITASLKQ